MLDGHANAFGLDAFKAGLFEVQDEGSQLIALACGARSGMKVVDACAGAGGKTLALAAEMRNRGVLLALDVDGDRLEEARRRARRDGVDNLRTRAIPAEPRPTRRCARKGKADVVLVDAPCSGLGTLRRKPDARWRLGPADPERFAEDAAERSSRRFSRLVKPGRAARLRHLLGGPGRERGRGGHGGVAARLLPLPLERTLGAALAAQAGATGNELRLWPHRHGTDGFFVAAFERRKE